MRIDRVLLHDTGAFQPTTCLLPTGRDTRPSTVTTYVSRSNSTTMITWPHRSTGMTPWFRALAPVVTAWTEAVIWMGMRS